MTNPVHRKANGQFLNKNMPFFHEVTESFSPVEIDRVLRRSGYGFSSRMNIFRQLLKLQEDRNMTNEQPLSSGYIKGDWGSEVATVHMIAGDWMAMACRINLNDDRPHTVSSNFEDVTCVDCKVGWLTYERDSYKESYEEQKILTETARSEKQQALETAAAEVRKNLDLMADIRRLQAHNRELMAKNHAMVRGDSGLYQITHWEGAGDPPTLCGKVGKNDLVTNNAHVTVNCSDCDVILRDQPKPASWVRRNEPIHKQFPLCLQERKADRRRCSMPFNHGPSENDHEGHFYNLILHDGDLLEIGRRDAI